MPHALANRNLKKLDTERLPLVSMRHGFQAQNMPTCYPLCDLLPLPLLVLVTIRPSWDYFRHF